MHLSPEFTQDSALAALVGGMGLGAVATIFAQTNERLLPSASPDAEVWTGLAAGAFALLATSHLPGGGEELAHALGADADEDLLELGARHVEEGHARLPRHGAREQSLPRAAR